MKLKSLFTFGHPRVIQSLHSHVVTILIVTRHRRDVRRSRKRKIFLTKISFWSSRTESRVVHLDVEDCSEELVLQQSYAIKNQLGHRTVETQNTPIDIGVYFACSSLVLYGIRAPIPFKRTFPCMDANYPYAIKNQRGQNTHQWEHFEKPMTSPWKAHGKRLRMRRAGSLWHTIAGVATL